MAEAETGKLVLPDGFHVHGDGSMQVPYVSGSARFDAMVIIPCSMGTVGRIAHGYSDSAIIRAADVFLKERRKLILVPRETPWNLIQARNIVTVLEAGADVIPAIPSFYHRPETVLDVADTVVARVLDHLGLVHPQAKRWMQPERTES
ncbi:MAG: UbiX family flavin prenyltransferase, partial [Verrucomicrobiota bacterium]